MTTLKDTNEPLEIDYDMIEDTHGEHSDAYHVRASGFYQTQMWRNTSKYIFQRDQGICQLCGKVISGRYTVHHIIPLTPQNMHLDQYAYSEHNLQTLHLECHSRLHLLEKYANRDDYICGTEVDFEKRDSKDPFNDILKKYGNKVD